MGPLVSIVVDGLDARVAVIAACGIDPDERLTSAHRDADGNEIGFGGPRLIGQ